MSLGHIGQSIWPNHLISEGWAALREKTHNALTYFHPHDENTDRETPVVERWGLVATDVVEHDDRIELRMEVPGMAKEDISVSISGGQLIVIGEKHAEETRRTGEAVVTERAFGQFSRTIPLPSSVVATEAKARYDNGILAIDLPKEGESTVRYISVL
jgi:HSP20 family protein